MDKATILSELKRVKPELAKAYGLTELALFGSYSRDEQTPQSDIDLMVDFDVPHFNTFFDCVSTLKDLFKEKEVQVVTKGGIKPQYFNAIKTDLLYA